HVQRLLQSGARADPTQVASVEVLGGPALTMMGKRRRHILDSGEGRDDLPVAPERALQRRRIHDRLEHRAHLTTRLSDPIELTGRIIATANDSTEKACWGLNSDQPPLGFTSFGRFSQTAVDACQSRLKDALRSLLQTEIQGGKDGEVIGGQIF